MCSSDLFIEKTSEQYYDEEAKTFLADRYITGECPHCHSEGALNPKKRRGLSVLLVTRVVDEHTRAREGLEWFGPSERNTLLHCVMYCLRACMNL